MAHCLRESEDLISALRKPGSGRSGRSRSIRSVSRYSGGGSRRPHNAVTSEIVLFHESKGASVTPGSIARALRSGASHSYQFVLSPSAPPARTSPSPEKGRGCVVSNQASTSRPSGSSGRCVRPRPVPTLALLCGKTSPEHFQVAEEPTSIPHFRRWQTAGLWRSRGGCWTLNASESPNDAAGCSLSRILQRNTPTKYSLSPRAARGILRRAERRGVKLPGMLDRALRSLLQSDTVNSDKAIVPKASGRSEPTGRATSSASRGITKPAGVMTRPTSGSVTTEAGDPTWQDSAKTSGGNSGSPPIPDSSPPAGESLDRGTPQLFIRRLTPLECERLQGFPDGWTDTHTPTVRGIGHWETLLQSRSRTGLRCA